MNHYKSIIFWEKTSEFVKKCSLISFDTNLKNLLDDLCHIKVSFKQ